MTSKFKLVVYVPESHAEAVRKAIGDAGAGRMGNYSSCSFSLKGVGRFFPEDGAQPSIGSVGRYVEVIEERIETVCHETVIHEVIAALKRVHPYEEVAYDVSALQDF
jgi:hypothetical protein